MKLTTEELRKIIKEELGEVVRESYADRRGFERRPVHDEMANVISKIKKARRELVAQIAKENPRMGEMEKNELILNIAGPNTVQQDIIDAFKQMRKRYDDEDDKYEIDKQLAARGVNVDELEEVKHLSTIISEELEAVLDEKKGSKRQRKKKAKKKKADDRCTRIAKRKYDVWPSAYASGAVVKCRRGKIWKGLKEEDVHPEVDEMINEEELTDKEMEMFRKILKDKGGAAGPGDITKKIKKPMSAINKAIKADDKIKKHKHGDIYTDEPIKEQEELGGGRYVGPGFYILEYGRIYEGPYKTKEEAEAALENDPDLPDFVKGEMNVDYMNDEDAALMEEKELEEAVYAGRTVKLNKPMRGDVKKFKVYVNSGKKDKQGRIKAKKVNFGHGGTSAKKKGEKTMKIRKSNPKARKNFRARHNCDNPGPKDKARYWSCRKW